MAQAEPPSVESGAVVQCLSHSRHSSLVRTNATGCGCSAMRSPFVKYWY